MAVAKPACYSTIQSAQPKEPESVSPKASSLDHPQPNTLSFGTWLSHLAHEAQRTQSDIEYEQRVESDGQAILNNTTAAQNTNTGCQRPQYKDDEDGNTRNPVQVKRGQERCDDKRE
jgi:hypothetical protein